VVTLRDALAKVLTDHGIGPNEDGLHSWRCGHPDRYPDYCHCVPDLLDALITEARAILAQPAPSLDAAWARVEAALPDGWKFEGVYNVGSLSGWDAYAFEPYTEDGTTHEADQPVEEAHGDTPHAALLALADALEARKP